MAGIYVHIPFCRKACTYCDFHFSTNLSRKEDMVAAIGREAMLRKAYFESEEALETLYFGGGTPSLLEKEDWESLLAKIHTHYHFAPGFEFSVECNPDDLYPERLAQLAALGVSRLSIGVQSFRESDLTMMNRSHNADQARQSILDAQAAGFNNLTVDLIYGIPGLAHVDWQANVQQLIDLKIPHVSAYALTVEEKTVLAHQVEGGSIDLPQDEIFEAQFYQLIDMLEGAGYEHYELSNFALPGFRSRHNSSYWRGETYLGLGPSAHSYRSGNRSWNLSNNAQYLKRIGEGGVATEEEETLTTTDQINEYLMTQLRLTKGVDLEALKNELGHDLETAAQAEITTYVAEGYMIQENGHLRLTRSGKMISNRIISDLFVG